MCNLGNLLSLEYGEALPAEIRTGAGFPVFGSNGIVGLHDGFLIPGPGIVVGRKGSVGKIAWSEENFWPIDTTYWVRPNIGETRWIYWMLSWLPLHQLDTSTGIPGLNRNDVYDQVVYLPEAKERKRIAQILDTLATTIRETEAIIAKLKAVKQGLLHDLLTRGLDDNGELRPPQSETPHLYKQSPLGWIPAEWEAVKLASLVSSIGQGWSPDCESSPSNSGNWGILKTTAITWAGYNDQENKALPVFLKARADLEVKAEDILITRAGPASRVGVVAYVESSREKLMISDKVYRLRTCPTELPAFISLALSSQAVQTELGRALSGMAESQTNISQAIVKELTIMRPLIEEQSAIAARVKVSEGRIREEVKSLEKLRILKSGLMDDLLTGRVRVTPLLNDPPDISPEAAP